MKWLVTGASRGIGRAITDALLKRGDHVVGIARNFDEQLLNTQNFEAHSLDLSQLKPLEQFLKELIKVHSNIDGLILNAGRGVFGTLEQLSIDNIQTNFNLNVLSAITVVKAFLPSFKRRKQGTIIFMGSEAALAGKRNGTLYCSTKFALRGFAQALRDECSTDHIRVTIINPGMVQTSFFDNLSFEPGKNAGESIDVQTVVQTVLYVLDAPTGSVLDEINLSPQKKSILFKKSQSSS